MTEPTDDELDAVLCNQWPAFSMQATLVRAWVRAAMRDALAKWGTQPAGAGGPVAWWIPKAEQFALACKSGDRPFAKAWEPLYATPQPTQAQAGAVPLTDEQIEALPLWKRFVGLWPETRREIVRTIERHHGIKGGQHGAE